MKFYVAVESHKEVASGKGYQIIKMFDKALDEENKKIEQHNPANVNFKDEYVLVYATKGSLNYPDELTQNFGRYYKYVFMNGTAKDLAKKHNIPCNFIGEVEEEKLPGNLMIMFKKILSVPI